MMRLNAANCNPLSVERVNIRHRQGVGTVRASVDAVAKLANFLQKQRHRMRRLLQDGRRRRPRRKSLPQGLKIAIHLQGTKSSYKNEADNVLESSASAAGPSAATAACDSIDRGGSKARAHVCRRHFRSPQSHAFFFVRSPALEKWIKDGKRSCFQF